MVTADVESTLFRRNVQCHQGDRDVNVQKHAALQTVHVVVPFDTPVIPACLICERQLLDQPVLREQMQRPIDRAVGDAWVAPPHTLENLARGQVTLRAPHLVEHFCPLGCVPESLPKHRTTKCDNESH